MTLETFLAQVNTAYRGSDDDVPADGTTDYTLWLATLNRKKDEWARGRKWASNFLLDAPTEPGTVATTGTTTLTGTGTYFTDYKVGDTILVSGETARTIATITSDTVLTVTVAFSNTASAKTLTHTSIVKLATQSYSLHRSFLFPSDAVYVTTTDDVELTFELEKPEERASGALYLSGRQPQIMTFKTEITATETALGGTMEVPGFYMPADLSASTDIIPFDDPYWGVYAVAAELAFNDLTYEDKAPDLFAKANNAWNVMTRNDRRGTNARPRTAPTNVSRIRETS